MKNGITLFLLLFCSCSIHYSDKLEHGLNYKYSFIIPVDKVSMADSLELKRLFEVAQTIYPSFTINKPGVYIAYTSDRCSGCGFTSWLYFNPKDTVNHVVRYYSKAEMSITGDGCFSIVMEKGAYAQFSSIPFGQMTSLNFS